MNLKILLFQKRSLIRHGFLYLVNLMMKLIILSLKDLEDLQSRLKHDMKYFGKYLYSLKQVNSDTNIMFYDELNHEYDSVVASGFNTFLALSLVIVTGLFVVILFLFIILMTYLMLGKFRITSKRNYLFV